MINCTWLHLCLYNREESEAVLSLAYLPANGSTMTVNATISAPPRQLLFNNIVTVGGEFEGCLDHLTVNQQRVALLNPLERNDRINFCDPRLPSETIREFGSGIWLFGTGSFFQLSSQQLQPSNFEIQFEFRTFDEAGLLLFVPSVDMMQYLIIYLKEGRVAVDYFFSSIDILHLLTGSFYNSGLWYGIEISVDRLNLTVIVNDSEVLFGYSSSVGNSVFAPSQILLLGGFSSKYSAFMENVVSTTSLPGCLRNLNINRTMINLKESQIESSRVDINGCPEIVLPGVRFMGNGRAEFSMTDGQLHNITFAFRTTQLAALLLHFNGTSVSVFHTKLRVDLWDDLQLVSEELGLSDNIRHEVSLIFSSFGNITM